MPLTASRLLQPDSPVKPAWAVFDPVWYLKRYAPPAAPTPSALLDFYLSTGCSEGHSPSPLFDEPHYLLTDPTVPALIKAGYYHSGFDHYCQIGHRSQSGHWLFDDAIYSGLHEDMSLENLDASGFHGRYDHYLRSGQYEHRLAHLLFDGRFYTARAVAAGDDSRRIEQMGCFRHFLYRLETGAPELPPSVYFDPAWPEKTGEPGSMIRHYLTACASEALDPVPEFSEQFYRRSNADVRAALAERAYPSGYMHFLQTGVFEFRPPSPDIDLMFYRDANAMVRDDLNTGAVRDAFAHLREIGLKSGSPYAPPAQDTAMTEAAAKQLFIGKARDQLAAFGRRKLDFSVYGACEISVVMVLSDRFALTMLALSSLRGNVAGALHLILVDNGSSDATLDIEQYVAGAEIIRLEANIGYLRACNLALAQARAGMILFLNNDIELGPGAVDAAIARLRSAPDIGAVGGKIIRAHGVLQEAGCIIWQDGSTSGYLRDASPLSGGANFVRDVDFCSGVFLLCRTAVVTALGGFDADFSPAYYEEADLCVRMAECGYRSVYDPAILVHHLEYGSIGGEAAQALMRRGQKIFQRKHAAYLKTRKPNAPRHLAAARSPGTRQKNILYIEDTIPLRRLGSGYARSNDIVHAIAATGHQVTIFPVNGADFGTPGLYPDLPDNVEVLHDHDIGVLDAFLQSRPGFYDVIWVSRSHNLARILPACLGAGINPGRVPFVLDTEAIATSRDAGRMKLAGEVFDFEKHLSAELENAQFCHCIAVNAAEASLLRQVTSGAISVLGTQIRPDPTANEFPAREGLLFAAAIHRADSPNLDALFWYRDEILPALRRQMPAVPVLNVAGYIAPEIDLTPFADITEIKIHGPALSLRRHYEQNRLFIAPTRFAAGTPYKLYEAASQGLPAVATDLLAAQLGWQDNTELLCAPVDDAKLFAARIALLYRSPTTWTALRERALSRLARENAPGAFDDKVASILDHAFERLGAVGLGGTRQRAAGNPVSVG